MKLNYLNSRINLVKNKVNWNILVTLGKKIKRDFTKKNFFVKKHVKVTSYM